MIAKIGFAMMLIGFGGLAEAYGSVKHAILSVALIGIGIVFMGRGDDEKNTHIRPDNRPYFLP